MSSLIEQVLAPRLFEVLRRRFGQVLIAKAGEPAVWGGTSYVGGYARRDLRHWGETYRISCLYCGDTRNQLSVSHLFGQSDANGRPITWTVKCFSRNCLADRQKRREFADMVLGIQNRNVREFWPINAATRTPACIAEPLPPGHCVNVTQLPPSHEALRFLIDERRFSSELLDYYCVCFCLEAEPRFAIAQGRIIIPVWFQGRFAGWQARIVGEQPSGWAPKYYTMD